MSRSVTSKPESAQGDSGQGQGSMKHDAADTFRVRTPEEVEALIERLDQNLHERMAGRRNITNSLMVLRRMRAARSRYLHRR